MNTTQHIAALLKEWLDLTRLESHVIQIGRWGELGKIQRTKLTLQKPLASAVEKWKAENQAEAASNPFHREVARLFELEARTSELLAVRKREVREKILLIEQALYDLRRLGPTASATTSAAA